jgi:hypothetical protein
MKQKPAGLHGFSFERVETKSKKRIWLYGQKFFKSVIPIDKIESAKGKRSEISNPFTSDSKFLMEGFYRRPGYRIYLYCNCT